MILTDFSQYAKATFFANFKKNEKLEHDLKYLRHLIILSLGVAHRNHRQDFGEFVICCDSSNTWRRSIFPYYKYKRREANKQSSIDWHAFHENVSIIQQDIRDHLNFTIISVEGAEADDIIGTLALQSEEPTLILSGDKDFFQLHKPNIKQWDNKMDRWLRTDNPQQYLFEHILRGDSGDGIPNVLSPEDTFVTGQRQKKMMSKVINEWWENSTIDFDVVDKKRFNLNRRLIDLRMVPPEIVKKIQDQYENADRTRKDVSKYFMRKGLKNLLDNIGDFR